jgi:hypothetical protein
MFDENNQAQKEINDAVNLIISNCYLQINGVDVAPPYVVGSPGGGKTQVQHSLCKEYDWGMVSTHFAMKPIEETGGIPQFKNIKINDKEMLGTVWSFPDIMGNLYELSEKHEMVIWLLDDMHLCGAIHMSLLYELLTERKLREYNLPKNVALVLAGNFGSNKAGAKTMFSAIMNRITLLPVFTSFEGWKKNFAIKNNISLSIQSFLGNDRYQQFFHEEEQVDTPWGSPRSWTRLSNMITALEEWNGNVDEEDILILGQGHVSRDAASEFLQYYKIFTKFDVPEILKKSHEYELPESPIDKYALAYALCSHLSGVKNRKTINKNFSEIVYNYLKHHPDLGIMIIHELIDMEKMMNKKNIYMDIAKELNIIEPGITSKLLQEVSDV